MNEKTIDDLAPSLSVTIGWVCARPKLIARTFAEGISFLAGYSAGRGGEDSALWDEFRGWLAKRGYRLYGLSRNYGVEFYVCHGCTTDNERYESLRSLFAEFEAQRAASN